MVGARAVMDIGVEQRRQEPRLEACIPRWARLEPGGGQRRGEERVEGVKGGDAVAPLLRTWRIKVFERKRLGPVFFPPVSGARPDECEVQRLAQPWGGGRAKHVFIKAKKKKTLQKFV